MEDNQENRTKHISPKFFFMHDLQQNGEINVEQIRSRDNLANLFTKVLSTLTFEKVRYKLECVVFNISNKFLIRRVK